MSIASPVQQIAVFIVLFIGLWTAGCQTRPEVRHEPDVPSYRPDNISTVAELPRELVRVAVMPTAGKSAHVDGFDLDRIVREALQASGRFEVVMVEPAALEQAFGEERYLSTEELPDNLPQFLEKHYGTRAVLFTDVVQADPYPPISLGLRQKLVFLGADRPVFLWAADEVFNAGDPAVAMGAKRYARALDSRSYPLDLGGGVLLSPRRFADYMVTMLFSTLPPRQRTVAGQPSIEQ